MTIWLVILTCPPMICPFTPPALLLPKSTRQGVYTNRLRLLKDVLFDTLKFGVAMGFVGQRPDCQDRMRNRLNGPPAAPWNVTLFAVEKTVATPFVSMDVPVKKTARFPKMLIVVFPPYD